MKVAELEAILAALPDDMEVHVHGGYARTCHVDTVRKNQAQRKRREHDAEIHAAALPDTRYADVETEIPPSVTIEGRTGWWALEPDYRLSGRWPAALLADLDAIENP